MAACRCSERHRPLSTDLPQGSNERGRQWVVLRRNESCSAFNGYRRMWSATSSVACRVCGAYWGTKAEFVYILPNSDLWPGDPGFEVPPAAAE